MGVCIAVTEGVYSEKFADESVIVNLNIGNYYNVRNIASNIWSSLQNGVSTNKLISYIAQYYKIDTAIVDSEVKKFIERL